MLAVALGNLKNYLKERVMRRILSVLFVVLIVGCSGKKDEGPVLTSTLAAPNQYQVEFENDYVRIIKVQYRPGEVSAMHSHEPFLGVSLTGGRSSFTDSSGDSETRPESFPGDLIDGDSGQHSVTSISDFDQESIFVEIKKAYPATDTSVPNIVEVAPEIAKVELEGYGMRVVRIRNTPNGITPLHSHRAGVSLTLTDMKVEVTSLSGEVREAVRPAGDFAWEEARAHSGKNLSDEPTEMILFELL